MVGKTFNTPSMQLGVKSANTLPQLVRVGMQHGHVIGLVFVILIILALISLPALRRQRW